MLKRWRRDDSPILFGLVLFGIVTIAAAVVITDSLAHGMLRRDAEALAGHWAWHIDAHLAGRADAGTADAHMHELYGSDGRHLLAPPAGVMSAGVAAGSAGAVSARSDPFHSGQHVGYVYRYAILDLDAALVAYSPGFGADEIEALPGLADERRVFAQAVAAGRPVVSPAERAAGGRPAHLARVFVPVGAAGAVERIVVVDADQSAAMALLTGAFSLIVLVTATLMTIGIGIPLVIVWKRIRDQLGMRERIRFLAMHDTLTNLPNRREFTRALAAALAQAERDNSPVAVLSLDVDRFRQINDSLGHHAGDLLLEHVSQVIRSVLAGQDAAAARLGGDEFAVMVCGPEARARALALANELRTRIAQPFMAEQSELVTSVAIGMAIGPADGGDPLTLLKHADMALYQAKQGGLNASRFYVPEMERTAQARREMERDLRQALARDELYMLYQPQVDIRTGRVTGYEALVRWDHPEKGTIAPDEFIPHAEENGLIVALGEWTLRQGCRYATGWPEPLTIAVNMSATQFMSNDIVQRIADILAETGLDPKRLELEITESLLLHNVERVHAALRKLDELGVSLALDDFGTGYSSLSYLARFPFRKIKIDRTFVASLDIGREAAAVVRSIVGLGRALGMDTLAEGVETAEQLAMLRAAGCSNVQGYLFGHPRRDILDAWEVTVRMARVARQEQVAGGDQQPAPAGAGRRRRPRRGLPARIGAVAAIQTRRILLYHGGMESAAIEIRPACASDAEALAGLHDTAWRCAYRGIIPALTLERMIARRGPGWWQHALAGAPGAVLKLTFADALAGYVSLGPARRVVAGCRGEIYEIYLAPPYQGVGLGARLFRAARARLAGAGRRGLVVWALADNEPACAFYRALGGAPAARGFERLGERSFDKIAFCWN